MKEYKKDGERQRPHVYWLAYKTQLIRCAPHHVRADVKSVGHVLDDVQKAINSGRQLRSRGVTRCYDLHKLNKHDLVGAEEDEQRDDPNGELEEESDHEMSPSRRRPRLMLNHHLKTLPQPHHRPQPG